LTFQGSNKGPLSELSAEPSHTCVQPEKMFQKASLQIASLVNQSTLQCIVFITKQELIANINNIWQFKALFTIIPHAMAHTALSN